MRVEDYSRDPRFVISVGCIFISSHTIEFYFDARKKYRPGCHDMVDTFLCCGGFSSREEDVILDETTWSTLSHVMVTILCIYLQYFAPHF